MQSACDVEVSTSWFTGRDKTLRRKLLAAVVNVSHGLSLLHPVSENANHPRLEKFENAVMKMCEGGSKHLAGAHVEHVLAVAGSGPVEYKRPLTGHSDYVRCCAVFAGGSKALSGSGDKSLKVWYLPLGRGFHGEFAALPAPEIPKEGAKAAAGGGGSSSGVQ